MMMGLGFVRMFLFWGALLALLAGGAWLLFRQTMGNRAPTPKHRQTARQIVDERLARGDISREDHETIRTRIEG